MDITPDQIALYQLYYREIPNIVTLTEIDVCSLLDILTRHPGFIESLSAQYQEDIQPIANDTQSHTSQETSGIRLNLPAKVNSSIDMPLIGWRAFPPDRTDNSSPVDTVSRGGTLGVGTIENGESDETDTDCSMGLAQNKLFIPLPTDNSSNSSSSSSIHDNIQDTAEEDSKLLSPVEKAKIDDKTTNSSVVAAAAACRTDVDSSAYFNPDLPVELSDDSVSSSTSKVLSTSMSPAMSRSVSNSSLQTKDIQIIDLENPQSNNYNMILLFLKKLMDTSADYLTIYCKFIIINDQIEIANICVIKRLRTSKNNNYDRHIGITYNNSTIDINFNCYGTDFNKKYLYSIPRMPNIVLNSKKIRNRLILASRYGGNNVGKIACFLLGYKYSVLDSIFYACWIKLIEPIDSILNTVCNITSFDTELSSPKVINSCDKFIKLLARGKLPIYIVKKDELPKFVKDFYSASLVGTINIESAKGTIVDRIRGKGTPRSQHFTMNRNGYVYKNLSLRDLCAMCFSLLQNDHYIIYINSKYARGFEFNNCATQLDSTLRSMNLI